MSAPSHAARFLLVEDDDAHAELVELAFEAEAGSGAVERVTSGEEAVATLRRRSRGAGASLPDVILLDLRLPRMDGHEVLQIIKADVRLRVIPVVVLTTSRAGDDRSAAYREHANSYVTKPAGFEEFQTLIRDLRRYWSHWNVAWRDA